jgi:hypothetical protein
VQAINRIDLLQLRKFFQRAGHRGSA